MGVEHALSRDQRNQDGVELVAPIPPDPPFAQIRAQDDVIILKQQLDGSRESGEDRG
jgi:hypothetical protein